MAPNETEAASPPETPPVSEVVHDARPGRAVVVGPSEPVVPGQVRQIYAQMTQGSAEVAGVVVPEGVGLEMVQVGAVKYEASADEPLLDKIRRARPRAQRNAFVFLKLRNLSPDNRELEASLWLENEDAKAAPAAIGKGSSALTGRSSVSRSKKNVRVVGSKSALGQAVGSKIRGARVVNGNGTLATAVRAPTRPIPKNAVMHRSGRRTTVNASQPKSYTKGSVSKKVAPDPRLIPNHILQLIAGFVERSAPIAGGLIPSVRLQAKPMFEALGSDGAMIDEAILKRTPLKRDEAARIGERIRLIMSTPMPPSPLPPPSAPALSEVNEVSK